MFKPCCAHKNPDEMGGLSRRSKPDPNASEVEILKRVSASRSFGVSTWGSADAAGVVSGRATATESPNRLAGNAGNMDSSRSCRLSDELTIAQDVRRQRCREFHEQYCEPDHDFMDHHVLVRELSYREMSRCS